MYRIVFFSLFVAIAFGAYGQSLKGHIRDRKGEPVVGATLYIREIAQGCVTDDNGEFQLALKQGSYTCDISSLGFEKQVREISVTSRGLFLDIVLEPQVYMLGEVRVTDSKEDPAYAIMRRAIATAPYHLNQVRNYTADVYTKGTMKLDKLPRLLMLGSDAKKTITPLLGKLFLLESVSEIKFTAPDKYVKKVVAFSSSIPDEMDPSDALDIIVASIYAPSAMGMVSPLSPGAFSYYRFVFEESYAEGGMIINRIRVEPRKKNSQLWDGWIYIADDIWSVTNFNLMTKFMGITARIKCGFHEVKPAVFLPTSYDISAEVGLLGIKAGGKYYSTLKYEEVEVNPIHAKTTLPVASMAEKAVERKSPKRQKTERRLEELNRKEELSTRDAYRLAKLTEEVLDERDEKQKRSLEMVDYSLRDTVAIDSLATKRDTLYWMNVRTLPLKTEELVSYQIKDSMKQVMKIAYGDSTDLRGNKVVGRILMGGKLWSNKRLSISMNGIVRVLPEYNFVDGYWLGQGVGLDIQFNPKYRLKFSPDIYYATARKSVIWDLNTSFFYAPKRNGEFTFEVGHRSADYKGNNGAWRFENSVTSFVCADNFMKFYDRRYYAFKNSVEVANGLILQVRGNYERRRVLENNFSYNLCKRTPKSNSPMDEGGVDMPDNVSANILLQADYTPRLYYRMASGRKEYVRTIWPTFSVRYEKGIPISDVNTGNYERVDVGVQQFVPTGIFDRISYVVAAGKFTSVKEMYFPDYKHFSTAGWLLSDDLFLGGYFLADYYQLSTNDKWLSGGVNYTSSYLLLKRLPFLQRYLFVESVHVRYLWTPETKHYTEWGYSLGIGDIVHAGVFFGFNRRHYDGVGVRVSIPILRELR